MKLQILTEMRQQHPDNKTKECREMSIDRSYENKEGVCARSAKNQHRSRLISLRASLLAALLTIVCLATTASHVDAAGVTFSADVTPPDACTIFLRRDGDLGLSADKKTLSSKIAGGLSGIADVFSGGAYDLYAETTNLFSIAPLGGNSGTNVVSRFSGIDVFRGRTFVEQDGATPVRLRSGLSITRVNVNLIATRTGSEFPGGYYTGVVVVRCE